MSHKAMAHAVEVLTAHPVLGTSERLILLLLADRYNDDERQARPSVGRLASESGLTDRAVRRNIAALERRGIVKRIDRYRPTDGGKTANGYNFPVLGAPDTSDRGGGHQRPGAPDTSDRGHRTPATGQEPKGKPLQEPKGKPSEETPPKSAHALAEKISDVITVTPYADERDRLQSRFREGERLIRLFVPTSRAYTSAMIRCAGELLDGYAERGRLPDLWVLANDEAGRGITWSLFVKGAQGKLNGTTITGKPTARISRLSAAEPARNPQQRWEYNRAKHAHQFGEAAALADYGPDYAHRKSAQKATP